MQFSKEQKQYNAAIYIRLSKDDGDKAESNSVSNQRELIQSFLKSKPEINLCSERVDDGFSGVSFDRPAMKEMLADIKAGIINCVIVKDLSRFGRNYIETGRYIEQVFPFMRVRFIAINDNFDSESSQSQSDGMIIPFKNLLNDAYSRDISIKVRSQINIRYKRGDFIGAFPVYGYVRSATDKHKLEIDEFAALAIRDIFKWKTEGLSNLKIANCLNDTGVLSPLEYKNMLGWAFSTSFKLNAMAKWSAQSVGRILKNEVYTGTMIQGKESSPNYKVKKKFRKPESEWIVVENTHDPIISKEDFALVNRLMSSDTRTSPVKDELYIFSGMIKCAQCEKSMIRRPTKSNGKNYVYYVCRTQKADKNACSNKDRISEKQLVDCTLKMIREQIRLVCIVDEMLEYIETLPLQQNEVQKADRKLQQKHEEYETYQKLIMGLYEDYKQEVLSKANYLNMKAAYEKISDDILQAIGVLETGLADLVKNRTSHNPWIEEYKRFKDITTLTRPVLVALVEKIVIINKTNIQIHFAFKNEYESALRLIGITANMNILTKKQCGELPLSVMEVR